MRSGNRQHAGRWRALLAGFAGWLAFAMLVTACGGNGGTAQPTEGASASPGAGSSDGDKSSITLVIGAYSVAKDALQEILPAFREEWKAKTGQDVKFQESYEASGTQARAIAGGFEADVAVLSMEGDIDKVKKAGLIKEDWKAGADGGMVTRSIVVMGTREGNPLRIRDFEDLAKPGVKVLYPNPQTSGGAQWDINAIYGAGLKMSEERTGTKDPAAAKAFLASVHDNIESMDKSGRASMAAFEYGVGDVIVTYENELLARIAQGVHYEIVTPSRTIRIENPAAVVDVNADKHGVRKAAEAFVAYLHGQKAQEIFAKHGFRPVLPEVEERFAGKFPQPKGLFDIEYLGGWNEVRDKLYSERGIWYQVLAGK